MKHIALRPEKGSDYCYELWYMKLDGGARALGRRLEFQDPSRGKWRLLPYMRVYVQTHKYMYIHRAPRIIWGCVFEKPRRKINTIIIVTCHLPLLLCSWCHLLALPAGEDRVVETNISSTGNLNVHFSSCPLKSSMRALWYFPSVTETRPIFATFA